MPVTLLSCIPYGLFGIPAAICIYGLAACRDTAAQNVCMGIIGFLLTIVTDNLLINFQQMLIPTSFINQQYVSICAALIYILLSLSGYIANSDMDELKQFFETKIFLTKNLINQGDYKLNQLSHIGVLEIKSLSGLPSRANRFMQTLVFSSM